ncbi:unnamed protein product [Cuscuta campestris]|uniref:cytokinin riboside 5'-monophosphate phosphoribohydrolase n=1 Tax=Cuscuta campestris TaxID=132261 RepID=A0A484LVG7_9ASTE|nr:unnamed protein product [Cuscuta campestris]
MFMATAVDLGRELLRRRISLAYGGGNVGLQGAFASTVFTNGGLVRGFILGYIATRRVYGPTYGVEHTVSSNYYKYFEMNHAVEAFIVLPGGVDTMEGLFTLISWASEGLHNRPIGLLNIDGYFNNLIKFLDDAVRQNFMSLSQRKLFISSFFVGELLDKLEFAKAFPGPGQLFLKRCKKKVLKSQDSTPRRRSGRLMNVMFRTKTKLHGGPEQIDLVGDESAQTGNSIEGDGISEDKDKEMGEVQPNARVDVVRNVFHVGNMQDGQGNVDSGGKNSASPTKMLTDGEEENSDDEVANDDDDGEERDEDEADIDGEEGNDDDGSESDGAQTGGDQESEEYEGDDNENDDDTSGGQGEDSRVRGGSVKGKTPRADCKSVERSSRRTIKAMKKGKERLQVFYVDRVSDFSRTVPRTYPDVLAWSGKELRKRENSEVTEGGFGLGHDDGRMSREARIELNGDMNERERDAAEERDEAEQENLIVEDSEEVLVRKIADKSKILASTIIDLLNMIQDAPKSMAKNLMFRKMRNVCHKVIGINVEKKDNIEQDLKNNERDMSEDSDFWSSPDLWAAVDEAEKAAEVRKKYEEFINDVPSFSLGMAQVLEEDVESNRENAKSSEGNEVNEVVTPANRTPNDPQHTPNIDITALEFGSVGSVRGEEVHHNKEMEQNGTVIGAEGDEVCHDLGANIQIDMVVEEGSGLKELVFNGYNILVEHGDLLTLESGHHISPRVVDAWSCILNHKELFRSVASPAREGEMEKDVDAYKVVCDALDYGWSLTNPCDADMLSLLIPDSELFIEGEMEKDVDAYKVVCDALDYGWSLTNPCDADMLSLLIPDSELFISSAGVAKIDKYDEMPNVVRNMVVKYFENKGMDGRVEKVKEQKPKRLQLPWRDSTAVFDYGVITMRHMETYTGQTLKRWDCGLKKGDRKAVNALRTKYCAAIVESDVNEVREKIRQLVKHNTQ